jgi:hypothetical protein
MYFLYKNEYEIFKTAEATIKKDKGGKKKSRGDEPLWACKETPCIVILNKQKLFFFLLQNQRTGGQNMSCLG